MPQKKVALQLLRRHCQLALRLLAAQRRDGVRQPPRLQRRQPDRLHLLRCGELEHAPHLWIFGEVALHGVWDGCGVTTGRRDDVCSREEDGWWFDLAASTCAR